MKSIITGMSMFDFPKSPKDAVLVTTNGVVNKYGYAVMGKGVAKEANELFKCSKKLGYLITNYGNNCYDLGVYSHSGNDMHVLTFPTKEHWRNPSTTKRIMQSAVEILKVVNDLDLDCVYMPPAGCGCGGLNWYRTVEPLLSKWLDDRFVVILEESKYGQEILA